MEPRPSPADDLPSLYRAILDGVAALERFGARRDAALLRAEATKIYSTAWDEPGLRRMRQIRARIDRIIAGEERPRLWRTRSRPAREGARTGT